LLGRLRKINRKGLRTGLTNLRLLRVEAAYCLKYLIPPGSLEAIHVYFPDPWPKRRHWKNRLVNADFVHASRRVLKEGGFVHLRTDHVPYYDQMREVFESSGLFRSVTPPPELCALRTDFEADFEVRGVAACRASYRLDMAAGRPGAANQP
jgi:tRNA (guanine-N7-)-methyltransferase